MSGRADRIEPWIATPARFTGHSLGPRSLPAKSIFTRLDAVTWWKSMPWGLSRYAGVGPGTRREMWVLINSDIPYLSARRYPAANWMRSSRSSSDISPMRRWSVAIATIMVLLLDQCSRISTDLKNFLPRFLVLRKLSHVIDGQHVDRRRPDFIQGSHFGMSRGFARLSINLLSFFTDGLANPE